MTDDDVADDAGGQRPVRRRRRGRGTSTPPSPPTTTLHAVLLDRCGNAAVAPRRSASPRLVRRLERQRFGAAARSPTRSTLHDRLIAACAARDVEAAVAVTTEIWTALLSEPGRGAPDGSSADFPRYPLLFGPSPVHRLDRLTEHLGGAAVWAKREDVNSGIAFGGNKTRKLEYLVADALAQGCDTLVSIGGVQSNHTRQVAAVAARVRACRCVLVQESWVDWPDAVYDKVGNILHQPAGRRRRPAGQGRVRHRVQGELGGGARRDRGARREAVRDPGRRVATTRWAATASPAGRTRWPRRRPSWASSSTPSSSAR